MANFEQHINTVVVVSGLMVVPLYTASQVSTYEALFLVMMGIFGGVAPDLDSDNAKPVQIAHRAFSIFLPLVVLLIFAQGLSIVELLGLWAVISLILNFAVFQTLLKFTRHRGIFHSLPMAVLMAEMIMVALVYLFDVRAFLAVTAGMFFFLGFVVHLLLDELISLNALGLHVKSSFGTAMKLYDKKNLFGTAVVYGAIVLIYIYFPLNIESTLQELSLLEDIRLY